MYIGIVEGTKFYFFHNETLNWILSERIKESEIQIVKTHSLFCQIFLNIHVYTILYVVFYGTFLESCTSLESTQKRTQTLATLVAPKYINAIIIILLLG